MLNKTMIAFTAAVVLGSASAAFTYEAPENKIGDRYSFLEQVYQPVSANRLGSRNVMAQPFASYDRYAAEVPENKIGHRYLFLEHYYEPVATPNFAGRYLVTRMAARAARADSYSYTSEVPENKIGDRYPFLEQRVTPQRGLTRSVTARRALTTGSIR